MIVITFILDVLIKDLHDSDNFYFRYVLIKDLQDSDNFYVRYV